MPLPKGERPPARIQIENVLPRIDCGRYPPKRSQGDRVEVSADIFRDGHEILRADVLYRAPRARAWVSAPMEPLGNDRWRGAFAVETCGRWQFTVEARADRWATWRQEIERKVGAGQDDLASEFSEGLVFLDEALERLDGVAREEDRLRLEQARKTLSAKAPAAQKAAAVLDPDLARLVTSTVDHVRLEPLTVDVDRERARYGAWYELFPRSWGGFEGVERVLPELAELGFDVVYLPPIHPIGHTNRKGRNNAVRAKPADPGSPWAIGAEEGGHTAFHPDLGTQADFERLVRSAEELGIDVCLDFAIQCSPDHPWLTEHPEWFHRRPDGTLKYAENPPKRYQDIYNVNFDSEDWRGLWQALRDVVLFWVERGVKVFRVDNPHTKPVPFWEWLIAEVRADHPDVVFLAEAFTRPAMMRTLAKAGFNQSYTYFTWKNGRRELAEYVRELAHTELAEYYRPNFFANTPDILHEYLQRGGRPAFEARLVLAATLSPTYGIYSGYEHYENEPVREGSEEYWNSEKYETKQRRLDGPLLPLVGRLNAIRRENPALQRLSNIVFLETENEELIAYAKRTGENVLVVCVNIDPFAAQEGAAIVPGSLGLPEAFAAHDLLTDAVYPWRTGRNYIRLDPGQSHIIRVG